MNCKNHENTEAVGMCTYCGKPFCKECLVEVKGKMYCKDDLDKVFDENKASAAATPQINITNTSSNVNQNGGMPPVPQKNKIVALVLCILLGGIGAHRFYVGKVGTGLLYLCTAGLCGIGVLVDFIMILLNNFRDKYGYPLV